jgi:hypothetical protein
MCNYFYSIAIIVGFSPNLRWYQQLHTIIFTGFLPFHIMGKVTILEITHPILIFNIRFFVS